MCLPLDQYLSWVGRWSIGNPDGIPRWLAPRARYKIFHGIERESRGDAEHRHIWTFSGRSPASMRSLSIMITVGERGRGEHGPVAV